MIFVIVNKFHENTHPDNVLVRLSLVPTEAKALNMAHKGPG